MDPTSTTKAVAVPATTVYTRPNAIPDNALGYDHYKTPLPNVFIRPHSEPIPTTYLQPSEHRIKIPSAAIETPLENSSDEQFKPIAVYAPSSTPAPFDKEYGSPIAAFDPSGFSSTTIAPFDNNSNEKGYSSTTLPPRGFRPNAFSTTVRPFDVDNSIVSQPALFSRDRNNYQSSLRRNPPQSYQYNNQIGNGYDKQFPLYDGVSTTSNGFRYYLPRQYHEEDNSNPNDRAGSYGYIDPFGIRRVVYYNASPRGGFQFRKNNRYVGFNATPYDPRPL